MNKQSKLFTASLVFNILIDDESLKQNNQSNTDDHWSKYKYFYIKGQYSSNLPGNYEENWENSRSLSQLNFNNYNINKLVSK